MSTSAVLAEEKARIARTARPYLLGGRAALSVGAATIHFAVTFDHFSQYVPYGVFFLAISWAQLIWPAVLMWRPSRWWLWLGVAGNALILLVYVASRTVGLPIGPDVSHAEPAGALDIVSVILEVALIAGGAALLWWPSLAARPVVRPGPPAPIPSMATSPAIACARTHPALTPVRARPA